MGAPSDASDLDVNAGGFYYDWVSTFQQMGVNPIDMLRACMFESQCWAEAHNPRSNAVGLIQFMPDTLKNMGYQGTWQTFLNLTAQQQVPWVQKYFQPNAKYLISDAMAYVSIFLPGGPSPGNLEGALQNGDSWHLAEDSAHGGKLSWAYDANKGFDYNHKGWIEVADLKHAIDVACQGQRYNTIATKMQTVMNGGDPESPVSSGSNPPSTLPSSGSNAANVQANIAQRLAMLKAPSQQIDKSEAGGIVKTGLFLGLLGCAAFATYKYGLPAVRKLQGSVAPPVLHKEETVSP